MGRLGQRIKRAEMADERASHLDIPVQAPAHGSLDSRVLYAADWIDVGVLIDELFDVDRLKLGADEKLRHYARHQPGAILEEEHARSQQSDYTSGRGSAVSDPWEFAGVAPPVGRGSQ